MPWQATRRLRQSETACNVADAESQRRDEGTRLGVGTVTDSLFERHRAINFDCNCRLLAAADEDPSLWGGASLEESKSLADEVAALESAFVGGPGVFRAFLEGQLGAPAVVELFAGGTATGILPMALR